MARYFHTARQQKRHQIIAVAVADAANFIFFKGAVFGEEKMLSIMPVLRISESQVSNRAFACVCENELKCNRKHRGYVIKLDIPMLDRLNPSP